MRIDDKESGHNHDLIFLHLHSTGFNNTVNFFRVFEAWKAPCQETGTVCQFVSTSTAPSGVVCRRRFECVIVYMMNTCAVHRPFIRKTCYSLQAIEKKAIEVKRDYRFISKGFVRALLSGNQGGEALRGKLQWSSAVNGNEIYRRRKWRASYHGLLSRSTATFLRLVRRSSIAYIKLHRGISAVAWVLRCQMWYFYVQFKKESGEKRCKKSKTSTQISRERRPWICSVFAVCRGAELSSCSRVVHISRSVNFDLKFDSLEIHLW